MQDYNNLTTLCYIERDDKYLMLHRVKKENDINRDKWIGLGGHFHEGESPDECLLREVQEESGILLTDYTLRGVVTFILNDSFCEYMFLYTASCDGEFTVDCDEGELCWVNKQDIHNLPLWQGDHIFLNLLNTSSKFFSLKLSYQGQTLKEAVLDGKKLLSE